jgi:hypothetical protein
MIVYTNSCSFGAPHQGHIIYPEVVAAALSANLINDGVSASCNRRIIRSSLRSLISLKKQHTDITALLGLSFISRTELWQTHKFPTETDGDFHPITNDMITKLDWSQGIDTTYIKDVYNQADADVKDYYKQWLIHMSKEAEVTNLLTDIIMLAGFAQTNGITLLVFCNTQKLPGLPGVDVSAPFLQDFVEYAKLNKSIIDLWNFSFADYALSLGHRPKDEEIYGLNGHPGEQAHIAFGNYLLKNYIQH